MDILTAVFRRGDTLRSRSVGRVVKTDLLQIPAPPARLLADWRRDVSRQLGLEAGDIEPLAIGRTRLRWPQLRHCVDAVGHWLDANQLHGVLEGANVALMASRGTPYHHDGALYGGKAFCNLFLDDAHEAELHMPAAGQRIALARGTVVLFDPCQPHAIIRRGAAGFDAADFAGDALQPQVFLTWELPIEHPGIARALGVQLDALAPPGSRALADPVWRNGAPMMLCPTSGGWLPAPEA